MSNALIPPDELKRIRCAYRSGLHEGVVGRLLDHIERTDMAAARELTDPAAPVHFRIEFDYVPPPSIGGKAAVEEIREWLLDRVLELTAAGRVTATYRGESESWETRLA